MADYYSLLARKIAALPQSTPQSRQAVYELARKALFNQLRAIQPPVSEQAILKEGRSLDEAIARLEKEATGSEAPAEEAPREAPKEQNPKEEPPAPREQQRPAAPLPSRAAEPGRQLRLAGIAAVCLVLVGLVAFAAQHFRERPEDLAKLRPQEQTASNEQNDQAKMPNRVGVGADESQKADAAQVARHATLYVASLQQPDKVEHVYEGSVVWRLENIGGSDGEPVSAAIRGDVDYPEAKLKLTFLIQKNLDVTLSASHMLKFAFKVAPESPLKGVKDIGLVQLRRVDASSGDQLEGLPVPITENNFLIGLARGDSEKRNIARLRTPAIVDIPVKLADGRIATLNLEKGPSGERVFSDALDAWAR